MADITKELPIDWIVPDDVRTHYANNIVVQHSEGEFIISFFQVLPPVIVGTSEETQQRIEAIKSVPAQCVARIVISPAKMESFINALTQNYTHYTAKEQERAASFTEE